MVTREFVVVSPGMSSSTLVDNVEGYRERRLPSGCASRQVGGRRQPVHVSGHWTAGGTQWCRDDCEFGIIGQKCNAVQLEGDGGGEAGREIGGDGGGDGACAGAMMSLVVRPELGEGGEGGGDLRRFLVERCCW